MVHPLGSGSGRIPHGVVPVTPQKRFMLSNEGGFLDAAIFFINGSCEEPVSFGIDCAGEAKISELVGIHQIFKPLGTIAVARVNCGNIE